MSKICKRFKGLLGWIFVTSTIASFPGTIPLLTAQEPKVEVCHYNAGKDTFEKISVPRKALTTHIIKHGDIFPGDSNEDQSIVLDENCNIIADFNVFARAYIDVNRNQTFNESVDITIAELIDSDDNGRLQAGDRIRMVHYLKAVIPCLEEGGDCNPDHFGVDDFKIKKIKSNRKNKISVSDGPINFDWVPGVPSTKRKTSLDTIATPSFEINNPLQALLQLQNLKSDDLDIRIERNP